MCDCFLTHEIGKLRAMRKKVPRTYTFELARRGTRGIDEGYTATGATQRFADYHAVCLPGLLCPSIAVLCPRK